MMTSLTSLLVGKLALMAAPARKTLLPKSTDEKAPVMHATDWQFCDFYSPTGAQAEADPALQTITSIHSFRAFGMIWGVAVPEGSRRDVPPQI